MTGSDACSRSCVGRSRAGTSPPSSTARCSYSSRPPGPSWDFRSPRPGLTLAGGLRLRRRPMRPPGLTKSVSVSKRIDRHDTSPTRSSARFGSAIRASALSSARPDTDAPSEAFSSSTTSSLSRRAGQQPSATSPFGANGTTRSRPRWSSGLAVRRLSAKCARCIRPAWTRPDSLHDEPLHGQEEPRCPSDTEAPGSVSEVVVPLATVEPTGAEAAVLETADRSHRDTGRSGPASPPALYRRGPRGSRAGPVSLTDIPFLRLLLASKAGEVVEVIVASHRTPPWPARHGPDRNLGVCQSFERCRDA